MSNDLMRRSALYLLYLMPLLLAVTRAGADAATVAIGLLFLLRSIRLWDWAWARRTDIRLLFALLVYFVANTALNAYLAEAPRALAWGRFIIFYAAVTHWLLTSRHELTVAARWGLLICAIIFIDTYWQYMTGISLSGNPYPHENRLGGPLSTPNIGNLLLKTSLPLLGVAFYVALEKKRMAVLSALCAYVALLVTLILISGERSSGLLTALAFTLIGIMAMYSDFEYRRQIVLSVLALGLAGIGVIATQSIAYERAAMLLSQTMNFYESPYGQLFKTAHRLWLDNPWFGIGMGEFQRLCYAHMQLYQITFCDTHPHNLYLQWLATTGLTGLLLFLAAMYAVVANLRGNLSFRGASIFPTTFSIASIAVLLWPLIITQNIFSNWPAMLFWYSLSLSVCAPRAARPSL